MADTLEYFDVERGLGVEELVNIIPSNGPPGTSGDSTTVPQGSIALDYTNGDIYRKKAAGSGTDKWVKLAGVDEVLSDISWREPVAAHDTATDPIPSGLGATDTRDGVTINDGDRVLFSGITGGGGPNVYIFTAESAPSAGDGFYTEDTNEETSGDRTYVSAGTANAGTVWTYNGSSWVLSEKSTDEKELTYLRNFIGKTAVGDLSATEPAYTSNNYIVDGSSSGDDLTDAASKIDAGLGTKIASDGEAIKASTTNTINQNIQALDDAIADIGGSSSLAAGTGSRVLDTVSAYSGPMIQWLVFAYNGVNVRGWTVTAVHDGQAPATPAGNTDRAVRARLSLGSFADSLSVSVTLGTGTVLGDEIDLVVDSNTATVAWKATRTLVKW